MFNGITDINTGGNTECKLELFFNIPKSKGDFFFEIGLTAFIVFFVILAVINIIYGVGLIQSILWLCFICYEIYLDWKEKGWYDLFVYYLGIFSNKHYADIYHENGKTYIRFGYKIIKYHFYYLSIDTDKIESIECRSGQATDMAKKDMNDWHIVLWYDHDNQEKSEKRNKWTYKPDQDGYTIGQSQAKESALVFEKEFIGFLNQSGVQLIIGEKAYSFIRKNQKC